jgi:hypothetical protein
MLEVFFLLLLSVSPRKPVSGRSIINPPMPYNSSKYYFFLFSLFSRQAIGREAIINYFSSITSPRGIQFQPFQAISSESKKKWFPSGLMRFWDFFPPLASRDFLEQEPRLDPSIQKNANQQFIFVSFGFVTINIEIAMWSAKKQGYRGGFMGNVMESRYEDKWALLITMQSLKSHEPISTVLSSRLNQACLPTSLPATQSPLHPLKILLWRLSQTLPRHLIRIKRRIFTSSLASTLPEKWIFLCALKTAQTHSQGRAKGCRSAHACRERRGPHIAKARKHYSFSFKNHPFEMKNDSRITLQ